MRGWKAFEVVGYDEQFMDDRTMKKVDEFKKKGKLFAMKGFLIFERNRSIRIVGEHDTFDKPTINMRTKDIKKVMKRLSRSDGGLMVDIKMFEPTVAHKVKRLKKVM